MQGTGLQRYDFDLAQFPDALCNDGTPAAIYFRPGAPSARTKWVIQLQGGGGCRSGDDCAKRWCAVDTNFGEQQMTSALSPTGGIRSTGILAARPESAFVDWNVVFIHYCSSDSWVGTKRDLVMHGHHPITGAPTDFRAHFLGSRILDATLAKLRAPSAGALVFTLDGSNTAMPSLDLATEVVLAGASAGGSGTIMQLDRVAAALPTTNTSCGTPPCALTVRGLVDSSFGPSYQDFDYSLTDACVQQGVCSWSSIITAFAPEYDTLREASCLQWHASNLPGTDWQCGDPSHVVRNHLTTPYFVRMGQRDQLHLGNAIDGKLSLPGAGAIITPMQFAAKVRADLLALSSIQTTAHEGALVRVPGVYGPTCAKHETLESTPDTYDVFIDEGAGAQHFFDVWNRWTTGGTPTSVVTTMGDTESCP